MIRPKPNPGKTGSNQIINEKPSPASRDNEKSPESLDFDPASGDFDLTNGETNDDYTDDIETYNTREMDFSVDNEDSSVREIKKYKEDSGSATDEYVYYKDRSYYFIFGPPTVGKTAFMYSIYLYLTQNDEGHIIHNINNMYEETIYENKGNDLIDSFVEVQYDKTFPDPTSRIGEGKDSIPSQLNFEFIPNSDWEKPSFEFCFMDFAGEDLNELMELRKLPEAIGTYIKDVDKDNMKFILILDPLNEREDEKYQMRLFTRLQNLLKINKKENNPLLIVVNKWDAVKDFDSVEEFLEQKYNSIWRLINNSEEKKNISYTEYSIGTVNAYDKKAIEKFDFSYPKRVFKWIYRTHNGEELEPTQKRKSFFKR